MFFAWKTRKITAEVMRPCHDNAARRGRCGLTLVMLTVPTWKEERLPGLCCKVACPCPFCTLFFGSTLLSPADSQASFPIFNDAGNI